mgnify:CR=1 FL=1
MTPAPRPRPAVRLTSSPLCPGHDLVAVLADGHQVGNVIVTQGVAAELTARFNDTPPRLPEFTAEILGHVCWVMENDLDRMARAEDGHRPPVWISDLIWLIHRACDEDLALLCRIYPGYVLAVSIADGLGLEELRALRDLVARGGLEELRALRDLVARVGG